MILVDSNVLLDVLLDDPGWASWSQAQLERWAARGALLVNPVVYAELAAGFDSADRLDGALAEAGLDLEEMPRDALFLAGKAHLLYRRRGGRRTGVLSDFFIGAHAAIRGIPLLTRDTARYRAYFPTVAIIGPG